MDDGRLAEEERSTKDVGARALAAGLRDAARACRGEWRWHWERFWILRWENALRRPSWRVDEETRAWRRMRAEVHRYAELRRQIAAASTDLSATPDLDPQIQESLTTIRR